jgi:hypothetical protein
MRNEAAARRSNHDAPSPSRAPASGRRIKAARPQEGAAKGAEMALAMTDALEHILEYEHRSA